MGEEFGEHRRTLAERGCAERIRDAGVETALDDVARERGARMIVAGAHGESPPRGVIPGSTPHKPLHISETPVLRVRG